jgi:hydrogenase maturation protease
VSPEFEKQILVAGVGNAFLQDDGFGSECARRLAARGGAGPGVTVMEFGTGGLDLAYEIMRGYDALVLLDASSQGGEPGTLYVIEPQLSDYEGSIEDGDAINPHGMDPATVLRFVNTVGGFSGKVVVIGCEPGEVEEIGMALTPPVEAAVERALVLVQETIDGL